MQWQITSGLSALDVLMGSRVQVDGPGSVSASVKRWVSPWSAYSTESMLSRTCYVRAPDVRYLLLRNDGRRQELFRIVRLPAPVLNGFGGNLAIDPAANYVEGACAFEPYDRGGPLPIWGAPKPSSFPSGQR